MNCKDYEENILEVLDKKELPPAILYHINQCPYCSNFYKYILSLEKDFHRIEKFELSPDFDTQILEKLKVQPSYYKILTLISPFFLFISFLFTSPLHAGVGL